MPYIKHQLIISRKTTTSMKGEKHAIFNSKTGDFKVVGGNAVETAAAKGTILRYDEQLVQRASTLLKGLSLAKKEGNRKRVQEIKSEINKLPWVGKNRHRVWDGFGRMGYAFVNPRVQRAISKIIKPFVSGEVLDIGSGLVNYFSGMPVNVTALDASIENLERNPHNRRVKADVNEVIRGKKLPFKANSFDTISMFFFENYLVDSEKTFRDVSRILKKGGRFIIVGSPQAGFETEQKRSFDSKRISQLLQRTGFNVRLIRHRDENIDPREFTVLVAKK